MMMVVMTHCINVYQLENCYWVQFLWIFIMTYSMPLFMMISGFWHKPRTKRYCVNHYLYPCVLFSVVNVVWGGYCGLYTDGKVPLKFGFAMWYIWALFLYNMITPYLLARVGLKKLMVYSLIVSFVCGFWFLPNSCLDAQRVVHFYPFYVIGIYLRTKDKYIYGEARNAHKHWLSIFVVTTLIYIIMCMWKPGFCYGTGFMASHGMSLYGFVQMWGNFVLTLLQSMSVIMLMPNRPLFFTKYGSRTMNVYMLHMCIIFPLCWYLMRPIMNEWYGYALYIIGVPCLCMFLFSKPVDSFMQCLLSISEKMNKK